MLYYVLKCFLYFSQRRRPIQTIYLQIDTFFSFQRTSSAHAQYLAIDSELQPTRRFIIISIIIIRRCHALSNGPWYHMQIDAAVKPLRRQLFETARLRRGLIVGLLNSLSMLNYESISKLFHSLLVF